MSTGNNFDGLRLLGAFLVLISHEFLLSGRTVPTISGSLDLGKLGLMLFFCISGYLVTQSWRRDPALARFAARRFLRIWPGLAAYVLIQAIIFGVMTGHYSEAMQTLANLVPWRIVHLRVFRDNPFPYANGSLWTIPLEVACYAALAALALLTRSALRYMLALLAALAIVYGMHFGIAVESGRIAVGPAYLPLLASFFFISAALAAFRISGGVAVAALAASVCCEVVLRNSTLALMLMLPVVTILAGDKSWPILRDAGRYGDLSYGVYVWAWPIQQVTIAVFGVESNLMTLWAVSVAATLAIAFASWHLIEAPALRLKPRSGGAKRDLARNREQGSGGETVLSVNSNVEA